MAEFIDVQYINWNNDKCTFSANHLGYHIRLNNGTDAPIIANEVQMININGEKISVKTGVVMKGNIRAVRYIVNNGLDFDHILFKGWDGNGYRLGFGTPNGHSQGYNVYDVTPYNV